MLFAEGYLEMGESELERATKILAAITLAKIEEGSIIGDDKEGFGMQDIGIQGGRIREITIHRGLGIL